MVGKEVYFESHMSMFVQMNFYWNCIKPMYVTLGLSYPENLLLGMYHSLYLTWLENVQMCFEECIVTVNQEGMMIIVCYLRGNGGYCKSLIFSVPLY